jgi:DUF2075 family protein
MHLYKSTVEEFIRDCDADTIGNKLQERLVLKNGHFPTTSEAASWKNSLKKIAIVFQCAMFCKQGIILEYQLPLTSRRIDCIITGHDLSGEKCAVLIELKQWSKVKPSAGKNEVITHIGNHDITVLHPAAQVDGYLNYLENTHSEFGEPPQKIRAQSCSYLHNYIAKENDPLIAERFSGLVKRSPVFTKSNVEDLVIYLQDRVGYGIGIEIANQIANGFYQVDRKLMKHISEVIDGLKGYTLIDEQLITFDAVCYATEKSHDSEKKYVILVTGGPGSGKSVVALKLLGTLANEKYNVNYATGSKAFTKTTTKLIGERGGAMLKYTNNYARARRNLLDVLIIDEAHRIRKCTTDKKGKRINNLTQFEELLNSAKTLVLFIDDDQTVRSSEIGSARYIRNEAIRLGAELLEFELDGQFRCGGAKEFVNWLDNTLSIRDTPNVMWAGSENFEFNIVDSPTKLKERIFSHVTTGHTSRLVAGFCWPWSEPKRDGTLVNDVTIGNFELPWNAQENFPLISGIPEFPFWATDTGGINQVGCVYSVQGFELDYIGIIFGNDLKYDKGSSSWLGDRSASCDAAIKEKPNFTELVKNAYRIMLTRGIKGCYVYFQDKDTENFFLSRVEPAMLDKVNKHV